jgi:ribosomal protein S18 acetylase RimI-like enzyme
MSEHPDDLRVSAGLVVRAAEPRDVPRIAATLTVATAESRWARWALPADGRVQRVTRLHELVAGHRGVATASTWVTDQVDSVAAWEAPPGAAGTFPVPADVAAALAREVPRLHDARAAVVAGTAALVSAARPAAPHWFLTALGTRPSARRRGLAEAVLAPVLRRCDTEAVLAAAAVHSWANVRWLRRLGFAVTESTDTADDELPLYVLVREPRPREGGVDVDSTEGRSYRG